MAIKIETLKLQSGEDVKYVKKGFAVGKKMFINDGYSQMSNPNYLTKGCKIAHYNGIMKVWIIE